MKQVIYFIFSFFFFSTAFSQNVGINADGSPANNSAMLDVQSTSKGMLVPRMTTAQRTTIASPATGLLVYDTDTNSFWFYNGTAWAKMAANEVSGNWNVNGTAIYNANSGSVGIGTSNPNSNASLDLGSSGRPVILPRLSSEAMNAVSNPEQGMMVYNTTEHQLYSYMRYRTLLIVPPGQSNFRWQPVSTGPRILAWGVVDSMANTITGGGTHTITYDESNRWYRLGLSYPHQYYKDSMLLIVTAVGNGSWDQAIATSELIEGQTRLANIKFVGVSRTLAGFPYNERRGRSKFHFVLYDLRKDPY
jgi:hypothetical protein